MQKFRNNVIWTTVLTALAGVCLGLLSLYFAAAGSGAMCRFYLKDPLLAALNVLPFVLFALLLFGLTGRAWLAFLLDGVVCLVYSWAAYWKWLGRSEPLYADDVAAIREAVQIGGRGYITVTWQIAASLLLVVLGTLALAWLARGRLSRRGRAATTGAALLLCVLGYFGVYRSSTLYDRFAVAPGRSAWSANDQFQSRGGIYPFLHSIRAAVPKAPDGYDKREAEALLAEYEDDDIPEDKKVHVVMTMLEAFCDFSDLTDAITENDPYADYHALQAESYTGQLFTNIFAGGTINTERCALTGFSKLPNFRRPSWSYARYFADQGYTCTGAHPGNEGFYSRSSVNRNLGLDDYWFAENHFSALCDGIAMDDVLFSEIAARTESQIAAGDWVFSFNVTYQNHGPYFDDHLTGETEYVPKTGLSDSDYYIVNNYLSGVADTGARMRALCETFRDSEEPVVLVFFADHKPWLGENSVTYAALGIDLAAPGETGAAATYLTDYLIWANDAAKARLGKKSRGEGPTVSPCFLMNVLFEQCGWDGPAYQKLTDDVMARTPIVSTHDWYGEFGSLSVFDALDEQAQKRITQMQYVQYYLARDALR